jgi:hypothetical protein
LIDKHNNTGTYRRVRDIWAVERMESAEDAEKGEGKVTLQSMAVSI